MGEVYRAQDTRWDRTVGIKVLPAHLASNAELKQRFERESGRQFNRQVVRVFRSVGEQVWENIRLKVTQLPDSAGTLQREPLDPLPDQFSLPEGTLDGKEAGGRAK